MLQDTLENTWRQVSGQVKRWWDGLTEDDLVTLADRRDRLVSLMQKKYGYGFKRAEQTVDRYLRSYNKTLHNMLDEAGQFVVRSPWVPLVVTLGLGCTLYALLRRPSRPRARTTLEQTGWGRHRRVKQSLLP